jgi:hypothetical protein
MIEGTIAIRKCPSLRQQVRIACLVVLTLLIGRAGSTAPIFTGSGAKAWVEGFDQFLQGSSGPVYLSDSRTVQYTHFSFSFPLVDDQAPVAITAYASATPRADAPYLLEVRSSGSSPQTGPTVGVIRPWPEVLTSASWSNVAATVQSPQGAPIPASIPLNFRLEYTPPDRVPTGSIGSPWGQFVSVTGPYIRPSPAGTSLQFGEPPVQALANGLLAGTFHLNLPQSSAGVSKQFSVGLSSELNALLGYTRTSWTSEMILALT